jgi:hypothetical protein
MKMNLSDQARVDLISLAILLAVWLKAAVFH